MACGLAHVGLLGVLWGREGRFGEGLRDLGA